LPTVQRIMNSAKHEIINDTPANLLFGNILTLNRGIFLDNTIAEKEGVEVCYTKESGEIEPSELHDWVIKRQSFQKELIDVASKLQRVTDEMHLQSVRAEDITVFEDGEYVLTMYHRGTMGRRPPSKFLPFWKGPLKVIKHAGNTYTLQNLLTELEETHHIKDLKKFLYDPLTVKPIDVAMGDTQDFAIERILAHRGDNNGADKQPKRSGLEFLIKWQGYDDSYNLWNSWNSLLHSDALRTYLISIGRLVWLPPKLRDG